MQQPVDIIIPTYDNVDQLFQCVSSILTHRFEYPVNIIIVNNGKIPIEKNLSMNEMKHIKIITPGENLGWIGGLQEGLKHSASKYVVFANDDIYIPRASSRWLKYLIREMEIYSAIGAIGPTSNVVMGMQNIWRFLPARCYATMFLIGFCILVRREALDRAGGVQDVEYGGDDIDLSIRLRKAGYLLVVKRDVFVYHHGFQTGERIHGGPDKPNGWNSREMTDNVNMELIRKHGFMSWWETLISKSPENGEQEIDAEGKIIQQYCNGGVTIELGCGGQKTIPAAIGVDIIPKGEQIPYVDAKSVADVVADVSKPLPFKDDYADTVIARQVLEHCLDSVSCLREWRRILKPGGRLLISCPDERLDEGVPINPEHLHAFTAESLESIISLLGFKIFSIEQNYNNISFTMCMEKV